MAITVYENKEAGGKRVNLDRRLCLTAAGDRLVEDDTAEAATLYGSAGKEVPRAEFEALGGVVKSAAQPEPEPPGDAGGGDPPAVDYTARQGSDLKDELRRRELPVSGNKAALVARLEEND